MGEVLVNIGNRRFTYFNQSQFAQFSGDFNPIHLDQIEARKTIAGQQIVHGVHSFLWMLECLIQREKSVFTNYDISFANQLNLEQEVSAFWDKKSKKLKLLGKNDLIHVSVKCEDPISCDVIANKISPVTLSNTITQPFDLDLSAVSMGDTFKNLCGGKKELAASLFPYLTEALGEDVVYEIALLSSIVGMIVPGLHSLFLGLKITFKDGADDQIITVNSKHELLGLIKLDYVGINLDAKIEAFFRPKSVMIPSCEDLSNQLPTALSMTGKKVLVIGGSRGLGAWVAKLVGISGGDVTITFNTGKDDAELVAQDVRSYGGICDFVHMNVSENLKVEVFKTTFDYLFYFATPKISMNKSSVFDEDLHEIFYNFYVRDFKKTVEFFVPLGVSRVLYPSTMFIDDAKKGFEEYIKAKIEGEKVCDELSKNLLVKFVKPRIPPVSTDQTLSLLPTVKENTIDIVLSILALMSSDN